MQLAQQVQELEQAKRAVCLLIARLSVSTAIGRESGVYCTSGIPALPLDKIRHIGTYGKFVRAWHILVYYSS
jgi:hypothetical protein